MDYKHAMPYDPLHRAKVRGFIIGAIYGAIVMAVILSPLWAQLIDGATP